jgi:copper transport protein
VLTSEFGLVLVARLAIMSVVGLLLAPVLAGRAGRPRAWLLVGLGLAGLATWPLSGHALGSPVPALSAVADVVHVGAMGVWLGGLVVLFGYLLRWADPRALAVILPVWSRWAATAVLCLVAGGLAQAVVEVGAVGRVVRTDYGRFLLAKVALLVVVLAAAAYARRMVRRRTAPAEHRVRLRRAVGFEVATAAVVLGFSAVLVQTVPARTAGAEAAATAEDSIAQTLSSSLYTLQFDIYPGQLGEYNTVHAFLYTLDGKPLPAKEWTLRYSLPEKGIEPITTRLVGLDANHGIGSVGFPAAGTWEVRFTIRTTEIDQATVVTTVTVR